MLQSIETLTEECEEQLKSFGSVFAAKARLILRDVSGVRRLPLGVFHVAV